MIDSKAYLTNLITLLQEKFTGRLVYVGLQGSYLRGEANENSDIDVMVVIDQLSMEDLDDYRAIIEELPFLEKSCGFICSCDDLAKWNPLEICHLLHSTKDYVGNLSELVPAYTKEDVRNFVKLNVNNLYHTICHCYIHERTNHNSETLSMIYKSVFYILQNLYYLKNDRFVTTQTELLSLLTASDFFVLKRSMEINQEIEHDFFESISLLFSWCQEKIKEI